MEKILILDFGSQYTQLIARRVRELNVYCEIHPFNKVPALDASVRGVILSGSPYSVRDEHAPAPDLGQIKGRLPLLGVCYGAQYLASAFGGEVQPAPSREYGRAMLTVGDAADPLMAGLPARTQVWMSHGDTITSVPASYRLIAGTEDVRVAAFRVEGEPTWGIQFHPEVYHSTDGTQLLKNFVVGICGCSQSWTSESFVETTVRELREKLGGDKVVPCLSMGEEENPFLGLRGIRWCLAHQEVFLVQLRALLRAGTQGDLRIMLPMISSLEELRAGRALLQEAGEQLKAQGVRYAQNLPVGIMIETPAAVFLAEELAQEADFFSIGTNDLTGYIMACDRGNPAVGHLYSPLQPAVLKGLRHVIQCGVHRGIPVSVCGEAASDQRLIPLLMAFGLSGFSVPVASVLAVRRLISRWTREEAEAIAEKAMKMNTEAEIAETLTK